MRKFAILGVFFLATYQVFAQSYDNITVVKTDMYVTSRLKDNTPVNFRIKNYLISPIPELDSYVILGYVESLNSLVVGYCDQRNLKSDTMCRKFSTFNLETKTFKEQVKFSSDVYKVSVKNDTLICMVNVKNSGGVGSHLEEFSTKIK